LELTLKRLLVCGDSYLTSTRKQWENLKGADWPEFTVAEHQDLSNLSLDTQQEIQNIITDNHNPSCTEIIAQRRNWEHITLALGGDSNIGIRMQIDTAVKEYNPDYVIIMGTEPGRFSIRHHETDEMIPSATMLNNPVYKKLIKFYVSNISDFEYDNKKSYYILSSGIAFLERIGIPCLFIPGPSVIRDMDWSWIQCLYPDHFPQLRESNEDTNHLNHSLLNKYFNHNTWEYNLKVAESALTLIEDWN